MKSISTSRRGWIVYKGKGKIMNSILRNLRLDVDNLSLECASLPAFGGVTREAVDITSLTDYEESFAGGAVDELDEFTVTVLDSDEYAFTVGGVFTLALSGQVYDADTNAASSYNVSLGKCILTGMTPATIEAGGNRVMTQELTFKPTGE